MENCATDRGLRRPGSRGRALSLAACLLALAGACATPATGPILLHPVPPAEKDYALVQGAIVYSGPGFTISARPWDYRLVVEEITRSGGRNPFGEGESAAGGFIFIRLRLENRAGKSLLFNPMRATMTEGTEAPLTPVENADIVAFADEESAAAEELARAFRQLSFDLTATVPAGGTLERYLIFRAPEEHPKALELRLEDLWLGATSFDLSFRFETYPGK
jgi:hypothetical protein